MKPISDTTNDAAIRARMHAPDSKPVEKSEPETVTTIADAEKTVSKLQAMIARLKAFAK